MVAKQAGGGILASIAVVVRMFSQRRRKRSTMVAEVPNSTIHPATACW